MAVLVVGGLRFDRLLDCGSKIIGLLLLSAVLLTRVVAETLRGVHESIFIWRGACSSIDDLLVFLSDYFVGRDLGLALYLWIAHFV